MELQASNIITPSALRDPLLDALVLMTQIHQKPFSGSSLTAGLPLEAGRLTPDLFIRAAERAGFSAKHVDRSLDAFPEAVLPVVLLLADGQVAVMVARNEEEARLVFMDDTASEITVSLENLAARYTGQGLLFKLDYAFDSEEPGQSQAHWFWDVIRLSRGIYGEVIVASLLVNLFALVTPLFIMNVYDRVVPNQAIETLWVLASGVSLVLVFDLVMKSLRGYFIDVAGKRSDILLSSRTFSRVMDIQMSQRPGRVGSFANNLQEFDSFREFFTSTTLVAIIDLPFVLLFVLLMYSIGGVVAFVPLLAIPLIVLSGVLVQKPLQDLINNTFTESARKHAMLIESLSSLDAIKGARAEGVMQRRWEEHNSRIAKLGLKSRLYALSTVNFAQIIQQGSTIAVVIVGVYQIMSGNLSVGGLIACTILTGRCLAPMAQVASIFTRYHHSMAAFKAINNVMSLPVERPEGKKFLHRTNLDGAMTFKSVDFSYPGQQIPALQQVSFDIRAGERVGIVGKMGSGKSTIHRLMLNFYQPQGGSILVSGTDINQLDPVDLRGSMGYVAQDVMLFDATVRENIVIGNPMADDATVLRAADIAGLSDFLNLHPEGFDLQVGERGSNLSGGQRQAIAIARALLDDPTVLLMDEPTNAMDNTSEMVFKTRLEATLKDRTLVLITHKTSMLSLVDRLIVMNDGKVVADGPRDEVLRALAGASQTKSSSSQEVE